jgi:hypothetical protein
MSMLNSVSLKTPNTETLQHIPDIPDVSLTLASGEENVALFAFLVLRG